MAPRVIPKISLGKEFMGLATRGRSAPAWVPKLIAAALKRAGKYGVEHMRDQMDHNRYTGKTARSIKAEAEPGGQAISIHPTLMRGRWDAGSILEQGTRPIPNAPWLPIKKWAAFRGIPAFPVWYKIRTRGVAAHPFLAPTLARLRPDLENVADSIVRDIDLKWTGTGGTGAGGEQYEEIGEE